MFNLMCLSVLSAMSRMNFWKRSSVDGVDVGLTDVELIVARMHCGPCIAVGKATAGNSSADVERTCHYVACESFLLL